MGYARLKFASNQVNAKQHPEAELLLFVNYSNSLSMLSSKNSSTYFLHIVLHIVL